MKKYALPLSALVLIAIGIGLQFVPESWTPVPVGPVVAVIVEESSDRPTLSREVLGVMAAATKHGIKVVDKDVKDKAGNTPDVLKPFIEATNGKPLPELVTRRGSGTCKAVPVPDSEAKLTEALK
jgi:hypothetical protein